MHERKPAEQPTHDRSCVRAAEKLFCAATTARPGVTYRCTESRRGSRRPRVRNGPHMRPFSSSPQSRSVCFLDASQTSSSKSFARGFGCTGATDYPPRSKNRWLEGGPALRRCHQPASQPAPPRHNVHQPRPLRESFALCPCTLRCAQPAAGCGACQRTWRRLALCRAVLRRAPPRAPPLRRLARAGAACRRRLRAPSRAAAARPRTCATR